MYSVRFPVGSLISTRWRRSFHRQADDEEMYEFLQDQRRVLLRMRQRRGSADDAPVPLARQPTTPIKAEYIIFE